MRHPYFKEAREADAKRAPQSNAEGVNPSETNPSHQEPQKPKKQVDVNLNVSAASNNKQNQPLVKTLPSIGHGGSSTTDGAGGVSDPPVIQGKVVTGINNASQSGNKHTTLPLFNSGANLAGSGVVAGSSLPPIAGGGGSHGGTVNVGDQSSRSNRSLQQQQQQQQHLSAQKKKKKNTVKGNTYAQQVFFFCRFSLIIL